MNRDIHSVQQAQNIVDQLRYQKNMKRIPVSQAVNDLIRYVQEYQKDDYLLNGFATDKANPYRPKNNFQCLIL